jgi:hypothetical protein
VARADTDTTRLLALNLTFRPREEQIPTLRQMLFELSAVYVVDQDALERLLMSAHEMLENLVKYTATGACEFSFELEARADGTFARIRSVNRATPERLADIAERLRALRASPDPLAHYDAVIRDSAKRESGSGLGLARIHAEGELVLEYAIAGDSITITAEGPLMSRSDR